MKNLTPITRINKFFYLYGLFCPVSDELRYVGITTNVLKTRLSGHLRAPTNGKIRLWFHNLKKDGLKPEIRLIKEYDSYDKLLEGEKELIKIERSKNTPLLNIADGGDINPMFGKTHTPEAREKISKTHKGRKLTEKQISDKKKMLRKLWENEEWAKKVKIKMSNNMMGNKYLLGHKHSEESKKLMSIAHMGHKCNLGYKHTEETKKLMSINNSGENNPMFGKSLSEDILKRRREKVIKEGTYRGENNPNFKFKISKEELIELYINQNKKIDDIAKIYKCHRATISDNLKKYSIKKVLNKYNLNLDDIIKYKKDGFNLVQIGKIYNCNNKRIHKFLKNNE